MRIATHCKLFWNQSPKGEWFIKGTIGKIARVLALEVLKNDSSAKVFLADAFEEALRADADRPESEWNVLYEGEALRLEVLITDLLDEPVGLLPTLSKRKVTSRVMSIVVPAKQASAVWGLAQEVWEIPPFALVEGALHSGDTEALLRWQEKMHATQMGGFTGARLEPLYTGGRITAITVITDTSGRRLTLDETGRLEINFPGGSIAAAGELIARIKGLHDEKWERAIMNGDQYMSEIIVYTEDNGMDAMRYTGPVHRSLGRAHWDKKWREANPRLAKRVLQASEC
jgi:hypothetical protein